jgi:hypothetical protein
MRRLSAVLFVAPDIDIILKPLYVYAGSREFSEKILAGRVDVK